MPSCCLQVQLLGKRSAFGGELRFTLTGTEGLSGAGWLAGWLAVRMYRSHFSAKQHYNTPSLGRTHVCTDQEGIMQPIESSILCCSAGRHRVGPAGGARQAGGLHESH